MRKYIRCVFPQHMHRHDNSREEKRREKKTNIKRNKNKLTAGLEWNEMKRKKSNNNTQQTTKRINTHTIKESCGAAKKCIPIHIEATLSMCKKVKQPTLCCTHIHTCSRMVERRDKDRQMHGAFRRRE